MDSGVSQSGRCDLHEGLRIEVTKEPLSMRQVANVVIALQRLKLTQNIQSTEFTDQELFNVFIDNVIEGAVQTLYLNVYAYILTLFWCEMKLTA